MEFQSFSLNIIDHVAHLAINRPNKSNSLHLDAWLELKSAFEFLDENPETRVIILSGEGKNFCAGIDLSLLMDLNKHEHISCEARKRDEVRKFIYQLQSCISAIEKCRKPVLATIQKACIGGGVDIIAACDIRYCTEDAYFCIKEIDMGLVADIGTMQRLPKILNPGMMNELALTGRNVYGPEAKEIGLVNKAYGSKAKMDTEVSKIAATIAAKSPLVVRGTKEILHYTREHTIEDSLKYMATYNAAYLLSDDLKESFTTQMTKRKAVYKD